MKFGQGTGHLKFFCPHVWSVHYALEAWGTLWLLPGLWFQLRSVRNQEGWDAWNCSPPGGLKWLVCHWQCRSTLSLGSKCPISPTALFQGAPGRVASDHILLLCCSGSLSSPDKGCPRQTGRLWTKSSSSNFLYFSGSLLGNLTWVVSSAVKFWIWWFWFRNLESALSHLRQ